MVVTKPALPLPITLEMFAGGDWRDFSTRVYQRSSMSIVHGPSSETGSGSPSSLTALLSNRDEGDGLGDRPFSPSNPASPYYGSLGRNTLVRVNLTAEKDTFSRTVAPGGWGVNDSGDTWARFFTGASNSATSFSVSGGVGLMSNANTGAYLLALLGQPFADVDVAITCTVLTGTAITGAQIEPVNIILRAADSSHYFMFRVAIPPSGAVTAQWLDFNGTAISGQVTVPSLTHSAASLRVRAQVEGQTLRGKVWDASGPEPSGWHVRANYISNSVAQQNDLPGMVGVRSGIATGNTNTLPVVFSYDNMVIRIPRFAGWLASILPTEGEVSGRDKIVTLTGGGTLRQLTQGQTAKQQSALTHDIPTLPNLIGYWSCEDDSGSTSFASGLQAGGTPMSLSLGISANPSQLASDTSFVGSAPLPVNNGSYWYGTVTAAPANNTFQARMLIKFPPVATLVSPTVIMRVHTTGSVIRWDLYYTAGGNLGVATYGSSGALVNDTGAIAFAVDGQAVRISVWAQKSGSDLSCQMSVLPQGVGGTATYWPFTVTGQSLSNAYAIAICPPGNNLSSSVVGQVTVESAVTDIFTFLSQFNGFVGERTSDRLSRLAGYAGFEFDVIGDLTAKDQTLGAQPIDTLNSIITLAVDSDGGLLYEAKGSPALVYRTAGAHMAAPAAFTIDRAQHQLAGPVPETYDDSNTLNDVTATRLNGSTFEAVQLAGPLNVAAPPAGVGPYPGQIATNVQSDTQLPDLATWAVHLGTAPDARYPQLPLNLLQSEITDALYWQILGVAPDTMFNLDGQQVDRVYQLARGYTETLSAYVHALQLNCAPGAPYHTMVLDDGITRLDSLTTTVHTALAATAGAGQSLVVDIADGTLWTTAPGDFPFDVVCGGERMTVTNLTGTSTPQTMTVTRAVNGILKVHAVGAPVSLFYPTYIALGSL